MGCGWVATNRRRRVEREREKKRERKGEKNKATDENEASGTRGTQRHANPRHPQPSFSLMIPVADCFIGENRRLEKVSTVLRLSVVEFFSRVFFFVIIYLFIFSYVCDQGGLRRFKMTLNEYA